ncbi:hypothetical protein D3C87_1944500 [compost metagenome]
MIPPNDMQAAGRRRRRSSGCDDVAIIDVERILIEGDLRVATLELLGPGPMGGSRSPVKHPGFSQDEGAKTQAYQPGAARMGDLQALQQGFGWPLVRIPPGRHDDGVGLAEMA